MKMGGFYTVHSLSKSCWAEDGRHSGGTWPTAELPIVSIVAAHDAETALLYSKHPVKAGVLGHLVIHLSCSPHKYYHLYSLKDYITVPRHRKYC